MPQILKRKQMEQHLEKHQWSKQKYILCCLLNLEELSGHLGVFFSFQHSHCKEPVNVCPSKTFAASERLTDTVEDKLNFSMRATDSFFYLTTLYEAPITCHLFVWQHQLGLNIIIIITFNHGIICGKLKDLPLAFS